MFKDENRHYSLRKLSVGLASVLIGISFASTTGSSVKADTVNGSNSAQTVVKGSDAAIKTDAKDNTNTIESNTKSADEASKDIKQKVTKDNVPEAAMKNATDGSQIAAKSTLKGNVNADKDNSSKVAEKGSSTKDNSLTANNNPLKDTVEADKQGLEMPEVLHNNSNETTLNVNGSNAEVKESQNLNDLAKSKLKTATLMTTTGKKFNTKMLFASKVVSPVNDTNGGFDSSWGKLNVNDWQGSVQGDYYQLTDYTGDANHVIVPNEADFTKAGISTSGKQVGVTSDLMHTIFRDKTTATDATVAFSKTNNKQVKAINANWSNTWGHPYEHVNGSLIYSKGKLTKFDGSNLDVANVTNMFDMFNENQISDLSSLNNWKTDNVTNMSDMFENNRISDLSSLVNWKTNKVTDMSWMFAHNQINDLSPLAGWKTDNVTNMSYMFYINQIGDLSSLTNWKTDNVTDMNNMFYYNRIGDLSSLVNWKTDNVTNMSEMFENNRISDLSSLVNWKTNKVTNMSKMFDHNYSTKTKNLQAKRVINFAYPDGYTGKKQDPVTQTIDVPQKVNVTLTTKDSKPSNNILDWVTKKETPEAPNPVYFQNYTVPEIKGLLEPDQTVISRQEADITKPINVTVTYKLVDSNTNDAYALDSKNGLHEHANVNNNGGYDEDYWGKLNINDWNYTTNDNTITITGYKGNNPSSLIIPNGADFDLANGQGAEQSNVEISSNVMHDLAKNATRIGLSKTADKKVIAKDGIWKDAFGGMTNGHSGDNSDGGVKVLNPNLSIMDLHNLDTSNITDMSEMFSGGTNLKTIGDLSNWNTSNVTDMSDMFIQASMTDIGDLGQWDTSKVTDMAGMFSFSSLANIGNLSKWDTSKVTNMAEMFNAAMQLTDIGDLGQWDVSNVTDMYWMFYLASVTNIGNLSKWNTSKVTDMTGTFGWTPFLTDIGDLSKWDTSNVTGMAEMFGDTGLTNIGDLSKWNTGNVTRMANMFQDTKFTNIGDLSKWNTAKVTDMSLMFSRASKLTNIGDLGQWDTHNVTNMRNMFDQASNLTNVGDLSNWNTTKVTDMSLMFSQASKMTNIGDLSKWDTSNVTDMQGMFNQASSLTNIGDLSNWNTDKVTDVSYMFNDNEALRNLNISNWNLSNLTNDKSNKKSLEYIFSDDANLTVIANNITLPTWYDNELTNSDDFWNNHMAVITNNDKLLKATGNTDTLTIDNIPASRSIFYDSKGSSDAIKVLTDTNNQYIADYHKANPTKFLKLADTVDQNDPIALANANFITVPAAVGLTVHFEDVDPNVNKDSDTVKQELAKTVELSGRSGDAADLSQVQLPTNFELSGDLPSATFGDTDSVTIKLKHKIDKNHITNKHNDIVTLETDVQAPDGTLLLEGRSFIESFIDQYRDLVTGDNVDGPTHWIFTAQDYTHGSDDVINKYIKNYELSNINADSTDSLNDAVSKALDRGHNNGFLTIKLKDGYTASMNDIGSDWTYSSDTNTYTWFPNYYNAYQTGGSYVLFKIVALDQSVHYQFMDNGKQVGSDVIINGKTGETVAPNLSIPENYELANGTTLPTSYTFAATNPNIQINLKHKTETSVESRPATRTINVHLPNGATKVYEQIIGYQRDVITDLVTQTVTRGTWTVNDVTSSFTIDGVKQLEHSYVLRNGNYNFAGIKLPKVPGYKAKVSKNNGLLLVSYLALAPEKSEINTNLNDQFSNNLAVNSTIKSDLIVKSDMYQVVNDNHNWQLPVIKNYELKFATNKNQIIFAYTKNKQNDYRFVLTFKDGQYHLATFDKENKLLKTYSIKSYDELAKIIHSLVLMNIA